MKKKFSFISGLVAFTLLFAPITNHTYAAESSSVEELEEISYEDAGVREDVYNVTEDVYGVTDDVYGVTEDVYNVTEDVYGVTEDVYGVTDDVYGVTEDVYGVTDDVYGVTDDVYGVTDDVYGVTDDVYGVTEDVYGVTDDVYGVTDDVYGVTEDVYLSDIAVNEAGMIDLDYSTYSQVGLNIDVEEVKDIVKSNAEAKLNINKGDVTVELPLALLNIDQNVTIKISPRQYEGSLGQIYDFSIQKEDGTYISKFEQNPITLKFVVDSTKVTNWDSVAVYYIDENGVIAEKLSPSKINATTGEVWVEVTHFSSYGVFEEAKDNSGDNNGVTPGNTTPGNNGTTGNTSNNATNGTTGNTNSNATSGSTNTTVTNATPVASNTNATTTTSGNQLPNTATNNMNAILFGLTIVALGGVLLFVRNRRAIKN
ncbi:LPXTG cell wall anchor domain-containing protein [Bacillus sp. B1-b2]|uniref:LPXTG cell wall anchor domain-containing protein n=1 Tax=Bacillus sp. B1-b2 TaxID=2653201 RepID=UPI0012628165|nr:LPXTG cell wall anchor domain-containing protein [Bacillus sp. B1-b2]KAB7664810.1 LPXTG cell wall anchor domain-containing protein [Bacillus sp. B1-b2]